MKIANLLEATGPVIAFSWGRFQPPHLGHAQVFKKVASVGKDGYWICTSQSNDPKKNPLDYDTKVALLKEMFPQYADHILYDPKVKTIYDAIVSIYNKMDPKVAEQTTLVFVGDPERIGDFQEGFRKYNGVQMRGGYYKFKDVTTFPNTDAADIRATDVRGAASSSDFNKFMQLTGTKGALAKKVYNAVRAGMGVDNKKLKEDVGYNFYELIKGPALLNLYDKMHHAPIKNRDMLKYVLDHIWYMKKLDPNTLRSIKSKFYQDPFGRNVHINDKQIQHYIDLMKHYQHINPVIIGPSGSIIDGNHRVRAAAKLGVPVVAYVAVNEGAAKQDLDVPTPTVKELAEKYRVTVKEVNVELAKGIKVEMEHTTDVEVAREIALDHLNEKLDYYTELAKVEVSEQQQLNEFIWPALAAAVRIGAPAIMRLLGLGATTAAKVAVKNPKKTAAAATAAANPSATMDILNTTAKVYNVVKDPQAAIAALAKDHWGDVGEAVVDIAAIVGSQLTTDTVKALATFAVKNALPIAGVIALLYGGKKLYDYITAEEPAPVSLKDKKKSEPVLAESRKRKRRKKSSSKRVRYGYFPWFFGTSSTEAGAEAGGDGGGGESLNELANEPYRYMLWKRTMMGNSYLFQTDGGQEIVVSMVPETLADGTNRVEVMFADKATFGLEKTGKGDAFRIFATVAQILKDYIKEAKFEVGEIYFTGKTKEPSRIKLYDKIARRLGNYIQGFEFVGSGDNSVEKGYFFRKKAVTEGEQTVTEVSMSPGALADFAKTDIAKSMTVGFEAEMAIEDMEQDEPNYDDSEPDWDANESVPLNGNWGRAVIRFFTSPDAAMNTRTEVESVLQEIDEEYLEWIGEQYQEWLDSEESRDTIVKFLKDYDEDISDEDIEDTIKFKKNNYWNSIEDDVREDWEADNMGDSSFQEFMEYNDYDTMQGIYDRHTNTLYWPYFTEPEYGGGSVSYEEIEMSFVETTGYKATVSRGYHSATRKPGVWIFEPDSSIEPAGVELVSPPMPLDEGLKALDDFFAWAKGYGAEANESTGFHMGVSIPEQTMDNIDHLKLILFLGDEYVLKQFGRESNTYTKSSLDKMRGQLRSPRANIPELLAQFKQGLNSEAAKMAGSLMVPKGDRYVSVNIKSNYIEFRSAGGNYFEKIPEIKNTMLRYVRAMAIAADPEAEKNEYAKKLYKLISTAFPEDLNTIQYFSRYAAGTITRSELKNMVTYARGERQRKAAPVKPKTYEIYLIGTNYVFHTFTARDDEEANDYATAWARQNNKTDWDVRLSTPKPLPGSTPGVVPGSTVDRAQQRAAAADPTLTTYSAKYRDQNGVEGSIGITASNYSQAQEQYMNLRRAYPHISFIGLQTNTSPEEAEEQRRRAAAAAGSTVGGQTNESRAKLFDSLMDEQEIKEITQNPSVWNRFLKSGKANLVVMGFEAEMVLRGVTDETQPVVTRNNNPIFPDIRTREGKKAFIDFWTQNNAQSKREAEIGYKAILDRFEQDDWKEWIEGKPTWKTFLDEHGVARMADLVYHEDEDFRMVWPFGMQKGGFTKSDLQKDFETATGYKSVMSNEYHGGDKPKNAFVFEPDSSIKAKSRSDLGQELVSPPMPLPKAMESLNKVYDWIAKSGRVYTNNSTGFHINVSMKKTKLSNIDQMKLLLLVGDQHILREFKRLSNEYCESLLGKLKEAINDLKGDSEYNEPQAEELDDLIAAMKKESWKGLRDIANDMIEEAGIDDKYVSMHSHGDYLEFRSPGGDWVNARDNIINTVLRITHAYTVAADPEEGRNDYLKKAYALIAGDVKDDELKSFIDYSMGAITAKAFKAKLTKKWTSINKSRGPLKAFELKYRLGGINASEQVAVIHAVDKKSAVDRLNKILDLTRRVFFVSRDAKEVAMQPEILSSTKGKSKTLIPALTAKDFVITYQNPRTGRQDTATVSAYTDQDARDLWNSQYNPTNIYKIISVQPAVKENLDLEETLKQVKGKWALVSRQDPKKVLQYYRGHGKPSEDWVNKVERRIQAFKHMEEAEDMKPAIFVDMDGTIADFFGEWAKLDGKDHYKDIEHKEDALDLVREHPTFWTDLPLLPNARELVKAVIDLYGEYYICSKPLENDPKSAPGKMAWLKQHFGDMPPKDIFFTDNKAAFAQMGGRPNVLIDDFGKYVDSWKAAGGIAIKYRPEKFPEVVELLRKLAK